jgi:Zn-dependent membrane protease YugP
MITLLDDLVLIFPGLLIAIWAHWRIARAYTAGSKIAAVCGRTGAEVSAAILMAHGLTSITVEPAAGELSNHYDTFRKVLRLSRGVCNGRSLTALGVASHEAGHAMQDAAAFPGLIVRNLVVPMAATGSQLFWLLILAGLALSIDRLIAAGIVVFYSVLILQLVNLPVELDASRRGRHALLSAKLVATDEERIVAGAQTAAAWTYVAVTIGGLGTFFLSAER